MYTSENLDKEIVKNITELKNRIPVFRKKYKDLKNMGWKNYVVFVFGTNSIFLIDDILALIKFHREKNNRTKRGLHTLVRNLLELYFYFRYITSKDDKLEFRSDIFFLKSERSEKTLFNSFISLNKKDKFIFSEDEKRVTSKEWINERIKNIEKIEADFLSKYGKNVDNEFNIMKSVEETCKEFDKENNILKVEKGKEIRSLEWSYNFLYRFQSMYAHQGMRSLEEVLNIYFEGKEKDDELEILSFLSFVSSEYSQKFKLII